MRLERFLVVLGLAFLIAAFIPGSTTIDGRLINRGDYQCFLVDGSGDLYVDARGEDVVGRNLSLYVLTYADTVTLVHSGSMTNLEPIFSVENVANFTGTIALPRPGWYSVVILPNISSPEISNMRYDIQISRVTPYVFPLLLFVISEILGFGIYLCRMCRNRGTIDALCKGRV
ncbi:MAG: hypothetical protein K9W43_08250 [Candidatus Thorarchaeota archaeon]|nr:hypothetical protein [Candidatus Thorarchaeota archaeon]